MKLDPRFLLPAALLAGALAMPGAGTASAPDTDSCPDGFMGPFLIALASPQQDANHDGELCVKVENMNLVFKDDNCNPNCSQSDLLPGLDPSTLPSDTFADNIIG